jgi:hypothetical protein
MSVSQVDPSMAAAVFLSKRRLSTTGMFTSIYHINLTYIIFIIDQESDDDDISVSQVDPSIAAAAFLSKRPQSNNPGTF